MVIKVGINGFGRIGRVISRVCLQHSELQLSAINDPAINVEYISYLIKFDSTHGKLKGNITHTDDEISVDDNIIKVFHEKLPEDVPWHTADVQYVVEASGMFTNLAKASGHLTSESVKRVIVTAPSVDIPMVILGVNDGKLGIEQKVLSCASSTLYCLAPIIKVLEDNFGVTEGFITSIHAMTPSLKPLDGLCLRGKHWRDHRSIHQNIIPATTGACKALGKIIPTVKDKLSGLAFRVPIVNVSVLDLTVRLNSNTSLSDIVKCVEKASKNSMHNILKISNEKTVSSDFIGEINSCIFDEDSSIQLKPNFFKIICWYENEYSYGCRVADSIIFSEKQLSNSVSAKVFLFNNSIKPRALRKRDEIQQTESYKKEISVSCCSYQNDNSSFLSCCASNEMEARDKVSSNQFIKPPLLARVCSSLPNYSRRTNELFKIWNDTCEMSKPVIQNKKSFFQSCAVTANTETSKQIENGVAQSRLEDVKKQFSKMVVMTEDLLKKTQSNQADVHLLSKSEFANKSELKFRTKDKFFIAETEKYKKTENDPIEKICGDCKSLTQNQELEVSFYSFEDEPSDFDISKISEKKDIIEIAKSIQKPQFLEEETTFNDKEAFGDSIEHAKTLQKEEFKDQLTKTINTLIEGLTQNNQVNPLTCNSEVNVYTAGNKEICTSEIKSDEITKSANAVVSQSNIDDKTANEKITAKLILTKLQLEEKVSLYEKYKTNNENLNVKLIDHELKKRNIVLVDTDLEAEKMSDDNSFNDFTLENVEPKRNITFEEQILEDLEENPDTVVIVSGCTSRYESPENTRCNSPENTNTTISIRNENKQDIYDKLDSTSATDSDNSFEINEKKSQVINITDLTNSFEDLARLDKICRIIEISDELSDKLFSALDKTENALKKKRWSFRDLCERLRLDDFCNKVFGKQSV